MGQASQSAERLSALIKRIYGRNPFYTRKLDAAGLDPSSLSFPRDLSKLPLTTKRELIADQQASPPWGTNLSEPLEEYTRYNHTSSTTGTPLRWLDTTESWQWMLQCWKAVYAGAKVDSRDRIFFPFSFGPFLGFWTAFEAGCQMGAHCIPAGGMSSQARLSIIETLHPTVICCTPTYALRLLEVAGEMGGAASVRELGARDHRGRRGGWQHPGDAAADRAGVGRACDRSSRPHRSRADQLRVLGGARARCI